MYLDYKLDESYTPQKIMVRAGTTFHDLHDVAQVDLEEPCGWTIIHLADEINEYRHKVSVNLGLLKCT